MVKLSIPNTIIFTLVGGGLFCYVQSLKFPCIGEMWMTDRKTIADLARAKQERRGIVAVSCYDYTTARLVEQSGVDMILVGDTAAQFILGFDSTLPAHMDLMVALTAAVRRGAPSTLLVADMPFLSYHVSIGDAIRNAGRFLVEAGAQMVKIEATAAHLDTIRAVADAGIAVMAHIGIRPQRITTIGRFRAEATTAELALDLVDLADRMIQAGASSLLLEGTATEVAQIITERSDVPVISCGAGAGCDGQILVAPDILGLHSDRLPKFAKAYADIGPRCIEAISRYAADVREHRFPDDEHSYHMKEGQLQRLKELLAQRPQ
jgi:3-methyl-2-oxobutanoate hydroxymethyltransferase